MTRHTAPLLSAPAIAHEIAQAEAPNVKLGPPSVAPVSVNIARVATRAVSDLAVVELAKASPADRVPTPMRAVFVDIPPAVAPVALVPAPPPQAELAVAPKPRPVDIAQISDSEVRSLRVPQLHEPGLRADGEPMLATRIAAMQVAPPPPVRLRESDRVALLAEAPTRMTVRIGDSAVGKVDFRMTDTRTIDVKLGSLLDVLAGHYGAAEFARLRGSAAAEAYVGFDRLRAMGLNLRYDPVYDELKISG
jgi:hypothetical protein